MRSEEFFEVIKDGTVHNLNDLAVKFEFPIERLIKFSRSLAKQGIIEYQENTQKLRIKADWKKIFQDENFAETINQKTQPKIDYLNNVEKQTYRKY